MFNLFKKAKSSINKIHWPHIKEIVSETVFSVIVATVLAVMVALWTSGIESVVNWIMLLF